MIPAHEQNDRAYLALDDDDGILCFGCGGRIHRGDVIAFRLRGAMHLRCCFASQDRFPFRFREYTEADPEAESEHEWGSTWQDP